MKQILEPHVTMSWAVFDKHCDVFYKVYTDVQDDAELKYLLNQDIQTEEKEI